MSGGQSTISGTIAVDSAAKRLDRALADQIDGLSRERIKVLILSGALTLNNHPISDPAVKDFRGMEFSLKVPEAVDGPALAQDIALDVVHEDAHLIIINKPAGLVVHPAAGHADGTLVNALMHHTGGSLSGIGGVKRPGIVHRIDKDTSGLMVAAKSDAAHQGLAKLFATHDIVRSYLAIVRGIPAPPAGKVEANIGRSPNDRKKMAVVSAGRGKTATTHYRVIERLKNAALVNCRLETGRTHQVRVHMAHIGHGLIGDPLYGHRRADFARQALHAAELGFIHPVTREKLHFETPMPEDLQQLFTVLRV
ncbi:MAG: RluA family pseudouridine synthase [Parasphingorhabdus sp.]|nr:RluA family pseudouridine synthase [Parasphingorhabdus sp.]